MMNSILPVALVMCAVLLAPGFCLQDNPMALDDPAPVVRMVEHGESAILIGCRVWVMALNTSTASPTA